MRRLLMVPILLLALLCPALAQFAEAQTPPGGPVAFWQPVAHVDPQGNVAIIQAPPVPPVEPSTSFSIGTWIADLLGGLVAIFGSVIATFVTKWVMAIAKKAGVEATQAMSDKLDAIITNGLHSGAVELGHDLTGKLNVQVKSQVIAQAVTYAQDHGAETIKGISGCDINDPKIVDALQARAAKLLSNIGPDAVLPAAPVVVVTAPAAAPAAAAQIVADAVPKNPPTTEAAS